MKPSRSPWCGFPEVIIHAPESAVKKHPLYAAAKSGDAAAAQLLVKELISVESILALQLIIRNAKPILISAHAYESQGTNAIPQAVADELGERIGLPVDQSIVQTNVVGHTGASGFARLARPALFDGEIESGREYLIVDDFVGQGGTLANLRGFIELKGGRVLAATVLTGKPYSAKLSLESTQLEELRKKHGNDFEKWWHKKFGYTFDCLTQSEARYLSKTEDADKIRDRITEEEQTGNVAGT